MLSGKTSAVNRKAGNIQKDASTKRASNRVINIVALMLHRAHREQKHVKKRPTIETPETHQAFVVPQSPDHRHFNVVAFADHT